LIHGGADLSSRTGIWSDVQRCVIYWILNTVQYYGQYAQNKKAPTYVEALEFAGGASLIRTGDLRIMIPSL
jgi:hypothetical protein